MKIGIIIGKTQKGEMFKNGIVHLIQQKVNRSGIGRLISLTYTLLIKCLVTYAYFHLLKDHDNAEILPSQPTIL